MKTTSTYSVLTAGNFFTYYVCTSDLSDTAHYVTKPVDSRDYETCQGYRHTVDAVIYKETQANGVLAVVGSEPKNIRH